MNYKERLHRFIPGGSHTYSRGDDQYPDNAPEILTHGVGANVWDPDGNAFLDYGMGLRSVTLGYANKAVLDAAYNEMAKGNTLARPTTTELQAAETLTGIIPGADMVKFAKNGSTVTSAAIKLARAYTDRKYIAVCRDHPFFSYDDWFIGSTKCPRGIPKEVSGLTLQFCYNDINSLKKLFDRFTGEIAAVIMEPAIAAPPNSACKECVYSRKCSCTQTFLNQVQTLCSENKTIFVLDEMITGFRWDYKGAQEFFGVSADLATFGKGMANGFSVAALTGRREIMQLGGIRNEGEERVFLVSTTHGAEMCGLGAFLKTMEIYQKYDVVGHLWNYGRKLTNGINAIAKLNGIEDYFSVEGYPCSPILVTRDKQKNISMPFKTLFCQEMVKNGVLMPWIALSLSHGQAELDRTLDAVEATLRIYSAALDSQISNYLHSETLRPVFRKFN